MVEIENGNWLYTVEHDEMDEPVGVRFRKILTGRVYAVAFTNEVCHDWVYLSHEAFFEKYAALVPSRREVEIVSRCLRAAEKHGTDTGFMDKMQSFLGSLMAQNQWGIACAR